MSLLDIPNLTSKSGDNRYPKKSNLAINVKDYGAKGDGTTDDTAAIQAAIDNNPKRVIYFSAGDYALSGPLLLTDGTWLVAEVPGFAYQTTWPTRFKAIGAATALVGQKNATLITAGVQGIAFEGLGTASRGIYWTNASWCQVRDVFMNNFADQFIYVAAGVACVIDNFLGVNGLANATRTSNAGSIQLGGSDHILQKIETSGGWATPLTTGLYRSGIQIDAASCFLSSCIGELSEIGIRIGSGANGNRLIACRADKNRGHGFMVYGTRNQITACEAGNNSNDISNTYHGFYNTGRSNTYVGCRVYSPTGGVAAYAYYDEVTGGDFKTKTVWLGCVGEYGTNQFYFEPYDGVAPLHAPQAKRIDAGTTALDATGLGVAALYNYSAATTITAFNGGTQGQTLTLISTSTNVTIQNNATILTNTGANKTLAAGRSYRYTFFDGKWYEAE